MHTLKCSMNIRKIIFLWIVYIPALMKGVKIGVWNESSVTDCTVDVIVTKSDRIKSICPNVPAVSGPLNGRIIRNDLVLIVLDAPVEIGKLPNMPQLDSRARVLVILSNHTFPVPQSFMESFDHFINEPVDVFDTKNIVPKRPTSVMANKCKGEGSQIFLPLNSPFSSSIDMISSIGGSINFCLISMDSRTAHFDAQLQWLQASLSEDPCRTSNWVIVNFFNSPNVEQDVISLVSRSADIVIVDGQIEQYAKDSSVFFYRDKATVMSTCTDDTDHGNLEPKTTRPILSSVYSDTSMGNIYWSLILALISGLCVNVSLRRSLAKRMYQPVEDPQ